MIFRIDTFNKSLDVYEVSSNTNERKTVTSYQILQVMANGYKFVNAGLTSKGFYISTNTGKTYIQIKGVPKELQTRIINILRQNNEKQNTKNMIESIKTNHYTKPSPTNNTKPVEILDNKNSIVPIQQTKTRAEARRQAFINQRAAQQKSKQGGIVVDKEMQGSNRTKINGRRGNSPVFFMGETYTSDVELCRKFNADLDTYRKYKSMGYSVRVALGLKDPSTEPEAARKRQNSMLDMMAKNRGEY